MPWKTMDVHQQRVEFVVSASRREKSFTAWCEEFGISRPTGCQWLERYQQQGLAGLAERSRRPHRSPRLTAGELEQRVVELRQRYPDWGASKLRILLQREGIELARSTIHRILLRRDLVHPADRHQHATERFQRERPNELWQMDFKSPIGWDAPVGPLSVIDDHSRYLITLHMTGRAYGELVREQLQTAFGHSGVPEGMLMDHGVPWWNGQAASGWTELGVWLMRQGIELHFSRIRHPQTQGKVERFHGALEMARRKRGLPEGEPRQAWLDNFRYEYNHVRPHEGLGMRTPASLWHVSPRSYDPNPTAWDYGVGSEVYRLNRNGQLKLQGRWWQVSEALRQQWVEVKPIDQRILVYYCRSLVREINLATQRSTAVDRWVQPSICNACGDNAV